MPELAKAYEPQLVEDRLYKKWQEGGYFRADPKSAKPPYSIVMPPPNVTGKLTLGHVLNNTLQDILCRKARMEGKEVLWLPGTDHAGLATQTAVEKHLRNTEKKTRHDFTREEFVARVWKWKEEFGGIITQQLRKLGCSCDWSLERFTMDKDYERAVQEIFIQLYNEKLIYRGTRMVNWCPGSLTAISDEEVIPTKQKGFLYHVKYALVADASVVAAAVPSGGASPSSKPTEPPLGTAAATPEFLVVATTRPETIMADVALAVKPGGKWAHLVGRKVIRPLHHAEIPIIADDAVEEGFGTGVLKVTPAHDKTDYEIGKRHNLPVIDILTPKAKINDPGEHDASELHGLDRFEARKRSAELLKERGLLEKEEPYENTVGFSERANEAIEPRLSEQWFLEYPNIEESLALLQDGHVKFHPEHWTKVYEHWLGNIQDWCISRQVWWGHRIPVWYKKSEHHTTPPADRWISLQTPIIVLELAEKLGLKPYEVIHELMKMDIFATMSTSLDEEAVRRLCWKLGYNLETEEGRKGADSDVPAGIVWVEGHATQIRCQIESPGPDWEQDPDTLDTWFSSWLWAYETMRTEDGTRKKFYPTSALVTGPDIIFLWVARMLIAGLHFKPNGVKASEEETLKANLAFKDVYFTGLIRDKTGEKLSKSKNNSPDPLDLIAKYGADGLRFGLIRIAPQGADIRFDEKQIEEGRNFCNKLWNICRFRALLPEPINPDAKPQTGNTIFAQALLAKYRGMIRADQTPLISRTLLAKLGNFEFSESAGILYDFAWNEFAAKFVEAAKVDFLNPASPTRQKTLDTFDYVMSRVLRLLHPFIPFVTEELWCELGFDRNSKSIVISDYPTSHDFPLYEFIPEAQLAEAIYSAAEGGRKLRSEIKIPSNQKIPLQLQYNAPLQFKDRKLSSEEHKILETLLNASEVKLIASFPSEQCPSTWTDLGQLYLPATGLVDPTLERDRLTKDLAKVEKDLEQTRRKLGDANMLAKAPPAKVEEWRAHEVSLVEKEKSLRESLGKLQG